jgi:hypothetical protein
MQQSRQPANWTWLWTIAGDEAPENLPSGVAADSVETTHWQPSHKSSQFRDTWHPRLDHDLMQPVRDDTFFHRSESAAWFHLIDILGSSSAEQLSAHSIGPVSYLQIYRQTAAYRGRLVDLTGVVRRAEKVAAPENELGIRDYWQAWLFTAAKPSDPIVVYLLEIPDEVETAAPNQTVAVSLTGFVFKRWTYQAVGGLAVAPVVIGSELEIAEPLVASGETVSRQDLPGSTQSFVLLGTGIAALATAWVAFRFGVPRRVRLAAPLPDLSAISEESRPSSREEY